jgi:DNA-binding Lrp family transcriptional regulator
MKADNYFAVVPEWVLFHPQLSDGAVRLYGVLRRYADKSGEAWPSIGTLSDRMKKSERQVRRLMRELEDLGALKVRPRYHDGGRQGSNRYIIVSENRTLVTGGGDTDDTPEDDKSDSQNHSQRNESQNTQGDKRDLLFEAVAAVWMGGYDAYHITRSERGRINTALTELRRIEATPDDVIARGRVFRKKWPDTPPSPQALVRNWNALMPTEDQHAHEWSLVEAGDNEYLYTCECGVRQPVG